MSVRFIAGVLLVPTPLAFNVLFLMLQRSFDYPGVLRRPTPQILSRFAPGGRRLIVMWYLFALSAALIIPGVILLSEVAGSSVLARIALPIGVFAGAVQLIGLMRWPFLVPYLARRYASPDASAAAREAIEITFESAHRFLGLTVGEHLGYLSTAVWTALIALPWWMPASSCRWRPTSAC